MHLTALVLDMDGVLWRGETAMPGLADFFATLRRRQLNFMLATNNATKIATQYTEKLARFGVAVPPEQILTSAEATAGFLRQQYPAGARIFVVGEQGLHLALAAQGFELLPNNGRLDPTARADLVVVGFNRHATYTDMATAADRNQVMCARTEGEQRVHIGRRFQHGVCRLHGVQVENQDFLCRR